MTTLKVKTQEGRNELKNRFVELRAKGFSYHRTAKMLKTSPATLLEWNRELSEEIGKLKAVFLEELYEKYFLLKESRITLLGEQLGKVYKELSKRDFSDVQTDKLLDLLLKYQDALKAEYIEPGNDNGTKPNENGVVEQLRDVLKRYQTGEIDGERAQKETMILMSVIKAIEVTELQTKLEALEAVIIGRRDDL